MKARQRVKLASFPPGALLVRERWLGFQWIPALSVPRPISSQREQLESRGNCLTGSMQGQCTHGRLWAETKEVQHDSGNGSFGAVESRFYLSTCDRRDRLWRCRGECYAACNIIQHDWFGGIRMKSLDPLSDAGAVGPGFLVVHNNARPHVPRVCRQFLENEGIDTIDWPTGSPDLNPIEHLWDITFRSIRRHQVALQNVQELSDALVQIWEEIPQDTVQAGKMASTEILDSIKKQHLLRKPHMQLPTSDTRRKKAHSNGKEIHQERKSLQDMKTEKSQPVDKPTGNTCRRLHWLVVWEKESCHLILPGERVTVTNVAPQWFKSLTPNQHIRGGKAVQGGKDKSSRVMAWRRGSWQENDWAREWRIKGEKGGDLQSQAQRGQRSRFRQNTSTPHVPGSWLMAALRYSPQQGKLRRDSS
ncbi:hypothetical protein NFI96_002653 [Prochilodus magdalenae]|nr:hypothetical protein NFI96_002653 [Prochilodus magdalenae]